MLILALRSVFTSYAQCYPHKMLVTYYTMSRREGACLVCPASLYLVLPTGRPSANGRACVRT